MPRPRHCAPITYTVGGQQYVTVQTGFSTAGSLYGEGLTKFRIDYRTQARRVLTFALAATATLPPRWPIRCSPSTIPIIG